MQSGNASLTASRPASETRPIMSPITPTVAGTTSVEGKLAGTQRFYLSVQTVNEGMWSKK